MQERMRSFLLGTMPAEARPQMEEEFFESHEVYDELQDSLNDLLDEYARGELSEDERRRVEDRLLISARNRARLRLSQVLAQYPRSRERASTVSSRRWTWLAAGIAAVCAGTAVWLGIDDSHLRSQVRATSMRADASRIVSPIISWTLSPQLARGSAGTPQIALPSGKQLASVGLETEESYPSYSVEVEASGRGRIWMQTALVRQPGGTVALWLPAAILTSGNYEFLLYGVRDGSRELLGSYPCRLVAATSGESPIKTNPAQ